MDARVRDMPDVELLGGTPLLDGAGEGSALTLGDGPVVHEAAHHPRPVARRVGGEHLLHAVDPQAAPTLEHEPTGAPRARCSRNASTAAGVFCWLRLIPARGFGEPAEGSSRRTARSIRRADLSEHEANRGIPLRVGRRSTPRPDEAGGMARRPRRLPGRGSPHVSPPRAPQGGLDEAEVQPVSQVVKGGEGGVATGPGPDDRRAALGAQRGDEGLRRSAGPAVREDHHRPGEGRGRRRDPLLDPAVRPNLLQEPPPSGTNGSMAARASSMRPPSLSRRSRMTPAPPAASRARASCPAAPAPKKERRTQGGLPRAPPGPTPSGSDRGPPPAVSGRRRRGEPPAPRWRARCSASSRRTGSATAPSATDRPCPPRDHRPAGPPPRPGPRRRRG